MGTWAEIEKKYSRLLKDQQDAIKYYQVGGLCILIAAMLGILAFGLIFTSDIVILMTLTIVAISSGILGGFLLRKWKRLLAKEKNIPAMAVYDTYKEITDFINTDFGEEHRRRAKKKLLSLAWAILQWKGLNSPLVISATIDNLSKAVSEKMIPIIESGSKNEIEPLQTMLFNFLLHLDLGITWESLNNFARSFNELPSVGTNIVPITKTTIPLMQNPKFRYPIVVVPSWLGLFVLFYYASGEQLVFPLGVSIAIATGILNFIKIR